MAIPKDNGSIKRTALERLRDGYKNMQGALIPDSMEAAYEDAKNKVNSQVAQGGERFMSPEESQANADFITNQIGEGAVSGSLGSAPVGAMRVGATEDIAKGLKGSVVRPDMGYGAVYNAPEAAVKASAAKAPPRINPKDLMDIYKRIGYK